MKKQYSPAPWAVKMFSGVRRELYDANGNELGHFTIIYGGGGKDRVTNYQCGANTTLAAAAPTMHELLIDIYVDMLANDRRDDQALLCKLRDAIADGLYGVSAERVQNYVEAAALEIKLARNLS